MGLFPFPASHPILAEEAPVFPVLRLLEKFKIFTAFYHLSELRSREDLMKLIIENLDYST